MKIKLTLLIIAAFATILCFNGCSKKDTKAEQTNPATMSLGAKYMQSQINKAQEEANTAKEPSTNGLGISDTKYDEIIHKSLVTKGNNYLIKQVLNKMRTGEEVIVAAIGGSVTEGAGAATYTQGYAYQFKDLFIQQYASDSSKVKFVPAGIGASPFLPPGWILM